MSDRIDELANSPLIAEDVRRYATQRMDRLPRDRGGELLARLSADPERAARVAAIVNWMTSSEAELPPDNRGPITKEEREQMLGYDPDTGV